jgi:predicted metal-dependent peptidase
MGNILAGKSPDEIAALKISTAKFEAMYACPFFGYLLMSPEYVPKPQIPTMGTDGDKIYYNVEFVNSIDLKELIGVMVHEVMHDAFLHIFRKGVRDPAKWNLAADFAVNYLIKNGEGLALPSGCVYDDKYKDASVEEIYADITKNPPPVLKIYQQAQKQGQGQGQGNGDSGGGGQQPQQNQQNKGKGSGQGKVFMDTHMYDANAGKDQAHNAMKEQEWKGKLAQAAVFARQQGKLPAGMERLIDEALEETAPWQQLLRRFLSPFALKTDFTWCKPNKRMLQHDIIMPGYTSESLEIAVGVDTSGSIGQDEISMFMNEIRGIMSVAKSYTIHIISCDAAVHSYHKINEFSGPLPNKLGGGGGTDFRPVFKEIEKRNLRPAVMVYLTDGYGTFPDKKPANFETIWAVVPGGVKKDAIPWGVFIPIKFEPKED